MPKNPHADFSPTLLGYTGQGAFRFWCQMALPLTYDDSLSYYELLNKVVTYLNNTIEDVANVETNVDALSNAYNQLQKYVNDYFDDLDVEEELRNVLDAMAEDGTLDALLSPLVEDRLPNVVSDQIDDVVGEQIDGAVGDQISDTVANQLPSLIVDDLPEAVSSWLEENVEPAGSAVALDKTLKIENAAADSKSVGDRFVVEDELIDTEFAELTLTNGHYISYTGDISAGSGGAAYSYSAPVRILKDEYIEFTATGYSTSVAMISRCDENGENIVVEVLSIDANERTYTYKMPDDGYVAFSLRTNAGYTLKIFGTSSPHVMSQDVNDLKYAVNNDLLINVINENSFEQGNWRNGEKHVDANTIRSKDGIHIINPSKIYIVTNGHYCYYSLYKTRTVVDDNVSFSSMIDTSSEWTTDNIELFAPEDCWLILREKKTYPTNTAIKVREYTERVYIGDNQIFKNRSDILSLDERTTANEEDIDELFDITSENSYAVANDLGYLVKPDGFYENGSWINGVKAAQVGTIRSKDGIEIKNGARIIVNPNGHYSNVSIYKNRTVVDDAITFTDLIDSSVSWSNAVQTFYVNGDCWLLLRERITYPENTAITPEDSIAIVSIADNQIFTNYNIITDKLSIIPDYWKNNLDNAEEDITNNRLTIGNKICEFVFVTDTHWAGNAKNSSALINTMCDNLCITDVLFGGDAIYTHADSKYLGAVELKNYYKTFDKTLRIMSTIGNHDLNSNGSNASLTERHLSPEELYTLMMKNEEIFTDTKSDPYLTVYDNASQKIRIIQFYHPDAFANSYELAPVIEGKVINSIKGVDSTWTVVAFTHMYWGTNDNIDNFMTNLTKKIANLNAGYEMVNNEPVPIENRGITAVLIVGHKHYDKSVKIKDEINNEDNLLIVATCCDIYSQESATSAPEMTRKTDTEQVFDVFQIDTTQRHIYITRVGAGDNRDFAY